MSLGLRRYQQSRQLHFVSFSCYRRRPLLHSDDSRRVFEEELESARRRFLACVYGYVVMPEHVHLLVNEPARAPLASMIQVLKQKTSHRIGFDDVRFWQRRYYDFNVRIERKRQEKLRYIHRNPVTRGLVKRPEDWAWSSFRQYAFGENGIVSIESEWAARWRERAGLVLRARLMAKSTDPPFAQDATTCEG